MKSCGRFRWRRGVKPLEVDLLSQSRHAAHEIAEAVGKVRVVQPMQPLCGEVAVVEWRDGSQEVIPQGLRAVLVDRLNGIDGVPERLADLATVLRQETV